MFTTKTHTHNKHAQNNKTRSTQPKQKRLRILSPMAPQETKSIHIHSTERNKQITKEKKTKSTKLRTNKRQQSNERRNQTKT